ncbi:hypothetical protein BMS3Abin04_00614 [bacterium BMS3Abin04]|nr:hypothetical protein BMS3Abin04_00614 [bacterium BMS3Abin04]
MNKKNIIILFFLLLLLSCSSTGQDYKEYLREVRFFKDTIHRIDRRIVTLASGSAWRANRFVIASNLSEVFFVLDNGLDIGSMYVNGTKYRVSHANQYEFRYNYGYLNYIKKLEYNNRVLELSDGSQWILAKGDEEVIKNWLSTPEVIVNYDETAMINPYRIEYIKVKRIDSDLKNLKVQPASNKKQNSDQLN